MVVVFLLYFLKRALPLRRPADAPCRWVSRHRGVSPFLPLPPCLVLKLFFQFTFCHKFLWLWFGRAEQVLLLFVPCELTKLCWNSWVVPCPSPAGLCSQGAAASPSLSRHRWPQFSQGTSCSAGAFVRGVFPKVGIKLEEARGRLGRTLPRLSVPAVNGGAERCPTFTSLLQVSVLPACPPGGQEQRNWLGFVLLLLNS